MTKKQQIQLFSTDDSSLRFHEESGCHFAAKWPHIPVHIQEAVAFSQVLPLVFRKNPVGEFELNILLNRKGKPVITDDNQWPIKRVPALLGLYPFSWVTQGEEKKLAYYADAPHFVGDGQKLITSKKKPTRKLRQYLDALQQIQAAFSATSKILEELNKQDILTESGSYWILSKQPEQAVIDGLSPALKQLLQSHVNSLQHLAIQAEKPAEKKTSNKTDKKADADSQSNMDSKAAKAEKSKKSASKKAAPAKSEKAKKPKKKDGVQGIIDQVCQSLSVSSDEVKGRKRGEILTQARVQLAEKSKEAGHFDQMAEWLQRSPATLNSWLR